METTVIAPNSGRAPSMKGMPTSATAQDDGPVNPRCEAHSNDCRTGCFVMRKIIAHIFGRNKLCTCQIPEHCWVQWCRKHYQRLRHRMMEQGWIFLQIKCLRTQLGRMEEWGEVQSFTIVLQRKFQIELNRTDPAKNPEEEAGVIQLPETISKSQDKDHTKASLNLFLYPFLGAGKCFDDVYAVIDAVEKAANEGQLKNLPPLQFLPLIDATLHPPPLIARPRKQRKAYKRQVHNIVSNDDIELEALVYSNTTKIRESGPSCHSSPALKSSFSHKTIKDQVETELATQELPTTRTPVITISEHEIKCIIRSDNDDATAQRIVADSTDPEVDSDNPSPVAQPSSCLNNSKYKAESMTHVLLSSSKTEYEIDEVFENKIQSSTVDKDKISKALISGITDKKYKQLAQTLANKNGDSAIKKRAGVTGLLSGRLESTGNWRKTPVPASRNAAIHEATEPLRRNNPIEFCSYPIDPTRTYQYLLNDTSGHIEAPAIGKSKNSAMKTHIKRTFSLEKHTATNEPENTDNPALYDGNTITQSWVYGGPPIDASTVTTPHDVSVHSILNTSSQQTLTQKSDTSTKSADSGRFSLAPIPSTDGDANTDPFSSRRNSARSISKSVVEPSSELLPLSGGEKRRRDAEEGSLLEGEPLGKRQTGRFY